MSGTKNVPVIDRHNLIPPYPTYKFFAADNAGTRLKVDDAANGFNRKVEGAANLFDRESKEFKMVNAWWLADISTLVYDDPRRVEGQLIGRAGVEPIESAGFTRVEFIDSPLEGQLGQIDTQCFVASNDDLAVVAFRGSETGLRPEGERGPEESGPEELRRPRDFRHIINDWFVTNAHFRLVPFDTNDPGKGCVHGGFKAAVGDVLEEKLVPHLRELDDGRRTFWFTGHSLGAALAVLAVAECDARLPDFDMHGLYTYGNPRVGDQDFVNFFDGVLARHDMGYFRFVNNGDIVTTVPPEVPPGLLPKVLPGGCGFGFRHTGTLKFINDRGQISDGAGHLERLRDLERAALRHVRDVFGGHASPSALLIPELLKDHVPTLYATHIWNAHVAEAV